LVCWCREQDLNLHGFPHTVLSRARLPVPPSRPQDILNQECTLSWSWFLQCISAFSECLLLFRSQNRCVKKASISARFPQNSNRKSCYKQLRLFSSTWGCKWQQKYKGAGRSSAKPRLSKKILKNCCTWY